MIAKLLRGEYYINLFKGHQLRIFWQLRHGARSGPRTISVKLAMLSLIWSSSAGMKFHEDGLIPVPGYMKTYSIYTILHYEKVLRAPYHISPVSKRQVIVNNKDQVIVNSKDQVIVNSKDLTVLNHEGNA